MEHETIITRIKEITDDDNIIWTNNDITTQANIMTKKLEKEYGHVVTRVLNKVLIDYPSKIVRNWGWDVDPTYNFGFESYAVDTEDYEIYIIFKHFGDADNPIIELKGIEPPLKQPYLISKHH